MSETPKSDALIRRFQFAATLYDTRQEVMRLGALCRAFEARLADASRLILSHREEFCWHGNTGKTLSADTYASLIDAIDAWLDGEPS